jgi:hypothetical protein
MRAPRHRERRHWAANKAVVVSALVPLLVSNLTCGGSSSDSRSAAAFDPDVARYRLLLRENPVDPGEAFRCYGGCQSHTQPDRYLGCLAKCPAFEVTEGVACRAEEVPPVAACITARRLPDQKEVPPGYVVVAVLAQVALIVALGAACSDATNCGAYYFAELPPNRRY